MGDTISLANHPDYNYEIDEWIKISDFVDGSKRAVCNATYILKYATEALPNLEASAHYASRVERSYNKNLCAPYLEIHQAHLTQPILIDGIDESLRSIEDDVTGFGESQEYQVSEMQWYLMQHGRVAILVDAPKSELLAQTKQEAQLSGERSYQILYQATHIKRWDYFRDGARRGQLSEVLLVEQAYNSGAEDEQYAMHYYFEVGATNYSWAKLKVTKDQNKQATSASNYQQAQLEKNLTEYEILERGQGAFDRIPVKIIGCGLKDSWIRQNVDYNFAHLNLLSAYTNINYNQGFQRVVISTIADAKDFNKIGEGIHTVIPDPDARVTTIEPGDPASLERELSRLESMAMRTGLMQQHQLAEDTRQTQSAESKAWDFKARNEEYSRMVSMIEEALVEIWEYHELYAGKAKPDGITVSIARDFGLDDVQAMTAQLMAADASARSLNAPSVNKEILKIMVSLLPLIAEKDEDSEAKMQRLMEEIEKAEPIAPPQTFATGFGNRPSIADQLPQ